MIKTKILVVDDRTENILEFSQLIAASDVEIHSCTCGEEALELVLNHEFALAVLDVQMPNMNAFELATLMRKAHMSERIPIMFMCAELDNKAAIFAGYDRGAVDFLLKPLDPHFVRSKVRAFVELDQQKKLLEQQVHELERLKLEAEEANQAKSRFLANMSHEIRTPLGAVMGFAELLSDSSQTQKQRKGYIEALKRNGNLLLKLIDSILDISKIEAKEIDVERVRMSLKDILSEFQTTMSLAAKEKGLAFELKTPTKIPEFITSDPLRLRQILNNVIGNAIKFTESGSITITISFDLNEKAPKLQIAVTDTGCGLSPEVTSKIFKPFTQADSSTTRRFGGTGLGLAIAKELAVALGGDVRIANTAIGQGSTFLITIDLGPLNDQQFVNFHENLPEPAKKSKINLNGIKVLLVDDAPDNLRLLSCILNLSGAQVDCAVDGIEAVDKALKNFYHVVLMDIQMPGADGYQAISRLRESGYQKPVLALTAHAMKEDVERAKLAGFDSHLSKPVDRQNLLENVFRFAQ